MPCRLVIISRRQGNIYKYMEQYTLEYVAPNRYPSACLITIYRQSSIVVVTDIDVGMSVTNACELIANEVVRRYSINPQKMIFIEQYRPGCLDQTADLVKFDFADGKALRHPKWIHISADVFKKVLAIAEEVEIH